MYPQIDNAKKKQQPEAKDESVRQEVQQEEDLKSVQPMGNEAANNQLMNQPLSDANSDNILNLSSYENLEKEINKGSIIGKNPSLDKISNKPQQADKQLDESDSSIDLNNSMYQNNSHNIVNENWLENVNKEKKNKKSQKPEKEKNPDQEDVKDIFEIAEEVVQDKIKQKDPALEPKKVSEPEKDKFQPLSTYEIDEDMRAETGRKKKKKKKKNPAPDPVLNNAIKVEGTEDVEDARWKDTAMKRVKDVKLDSGPEATDAFHVEEMEKIKNWSFNSEDMSKIKKTGKLRRFLTWTAVGFGKLLGKALQIITLGHFWRAKSSLRFVFTNTKKWQLTKDYQNIPGWDGAKFDPSANKGEDVLADFRRVPTVWSRLTAAKAAETVQKDGKEEEKPLDPVISVLVDQPKTGSSKSMESDEMGHTMLGIEYSRKSAVSGRYERYKLQYGFYPAGGTTGMSGGSVMQRHNAVLPGQLIDDYGHSYDISRSYPAKPEQVSKIFQASEKYAEGGYSYYDRNCSTFVKEMVVNTAHLATGGDIFKQSEVGFSHLANLGMFAAEAFDQNTKAGAENLLMDLAKKNDQSYQNYGNKRATARDWVNYRGSMSKGSSLTKKTFVPAEIGEQMRRMAGDESGEIGSFKFNDPLKSGQEGDDSILLGLDKINSGIEQIGTDIQMQFEEILPAEQQHNAPFEVATIANTLSGMGAPLALLDLEITRKLNKENEKKAENKKLKREDIREQFFVTPEMLRKTREELSDNISKVNVLLMKYFKNDKRLHQPLLNLISLLNYGINYVDDLYRYSVRGGLNAKKDVINIREEIMQNLYTVRAGGKEIKITPNHYESYIQIYKDPKTAVEKYDKLQKLREKKKNADWTKSKMSVVGHKAQSIFGLEDEEGLTIAELKELNKLERIDRLALEFDNSHNYMIEKDEYNQQDIDYAFRMHDKETNGLQTRDEVPIGEEDVNQDMRDKYRSASGVYITLFMDKIFKDIKEQWMKGANEGGLSEDAANDPGISAAWLDDYLAKRIKQKENDFQMIVRGLYRSMKADDPNKKIDDKEVIEKLADVLTWTIIDRKFVSVGGERKEVFGGMFLPMALGQMSTNRRMKFNQLVTSMIRICQMEEKDQNLTAMKKQVH